MFRTLILLVLAVPAFAQGIYNGGSISGGTLGAIGGSLPPASAPSFSPVGGVYTSPQTVTISSLTPGAIICYNFGGSPATNGGSGCAAGSTLYASPISVSTTETVYAVAGGSGYSDSTVSSATYTITAGGGALWSGILSPVPSGTSTAGLAQAIDWSTAGVAGGIPSGSWTQCTTGACATANSAGTSATAAQINSALTACGTAGSEYVLLAVGTYSLTASLSIPSNCELRGAAPSTTIVKFNESGSTYITIGNGNLLYNLWNPSPTQDVSITSGATAGSTSIVVSSTSGISAGMDAVIDQLNDGTIITSSGSQALCTQCDGGQTSNGSRAQGQVVRITNVNSGTSTLTISPALFVEYARTPLLTYYTPAAKNAGIGNLQIYADNGTANNKSNIQIEACDTCWIYQSASNYTYGDHVDLDFCYHCQIDSNYFSNTYGNGPGGFDHGVTVRNKTTLSLIQNNIFDRTGILEPEWGPAGDVLAYNYLTGDFSVTAPNFMAANIEDHGANPQFILVEGNVASKFNPDSIWGSATSYTTLRNWWTGADLVCGYYVSTGGSTVNLIAGPPFTSGLVGNSFNINGTNYTVSTYINGTQITLTTSAGTQTNVPYYYNGNRMPVVCSPEGPQGTAGNNSWWGIQANRAVEFNFLDTYANFVGDVVGSANQNALTYYNGGTPLTYSQFVNEPTTRVYDTLAIGMSFGYFDVNSTNGSSGSSTPYSTATFYNEYNFVGATPSTTCSGSCTHAIPPSFYLATQPSWWKGIPWPAVGSDLTSGAAAGGRVYSLTASNPAQNCYFNIMGGSLGGPGSPLPFNPANCYGGAPVVYNARTDTCVHGYSTNAPNVAPFYNPSNETCIAGKTTGESGSALVFQEGPTDPLPFNRLDAGTNPAVSNTCFVDPDFGAYTCFVTDNTAAYPGTNPSTIYGMGSDGAYDAFGLGTVNDVMFTFQNNGGVPFFTHMIESRFLAHSCSPTNKCFIPSNVAGTVGYNPASCVAPCTATQVTAGAVAYGRNASDAPNTTYELNLPQNYKDTWVEGFSAGFPTGTDHISRVLYNDFSSDGPGNALPCSVVPSDYVSTWNGQFANSDDGAYTIASGGGGSYQTIVQQPGASAGSGSTVVISGIDVFIRPVNNQPAGSSNWMFQASAGTTSGTEPNWATGCATAGLTCPDGTVTWTNIGKVGGQGPGFDILFFDPNRGCSRINTRLHKMYRGHNEGSAWPASGTADPSGNLIANDAVTCFRMGGTNCGTGGTVQFTDITTIHDSSTTLNGRYSLMEPTSANAVSSPSYSCTSGSVLWTNFQTWPNAKFVSGNSYTAGKYVTSPVDNNYYVLGGTGTNTYTTDPSADPTNWTKKSGICFGYYVDWYGGMMNPSLALGPDFGSDGHGQQGHLYDFHGQTFWTHLLSQPNCNNNTSPGCNGGTSPSCSVSVPNNNYVGAPNPGCKTLPLGLPSDYHPSYRGSGLLDLQPLIFFTTQVPAWGGVNMQGVQGGGTGVGGYCCSGYLELAAVAVGGTQLLYRFGHNYCSGSNGTFSGENCIGVESQNGKEGAFGSDFMNTRGDTASGSATCGSGVGAGAGPLRGQYGPLQSRTISLNDTLYPATNNNNHYSIYKAVGFYSGTFPSGSYITTGTGTEGTSIPNWDTLCSTPGGYCTSDGGNNPATSQSLDGNVLWLNLGKNSCNVSIGVMDLTSAHPQP